MSDIISINVETLLPQKRPFIFIDKLVECSQDFAKTVFNIKQDNVLVIDNVLSEAGLMENIAQTCAARIGYLNMKGGKGVNVGVIGNVKDFEIKNLPPANQTIETSIKVLNIFGSITMVEAIVKLNDEIIATGEMKVSEQ